MNAPADRPAWPAAGGEMAGLIRRLDWAATPLGPLATWPQSLRTAIDLLLASGFPTCLQWGAAGHLIYNDAARPLMADKHPGALGRPIFDSTPEIRATWAPVLAAVLAGQTVTLQDQPYGLHRDGAGEQAWFTHSCSPLRDEAGGVVALWSVYIETTARLRAEWRRDQVEAALRAGEEQQAFLLRLSDALRPLAEATAVQATAARLLGEHLDASRVLYVDIIDEQEAEVRLDYTRGVPSLAGRWKADAFGDAVMRQLRHSQILVIDDAQREPVLADANRALFAELQIGATIAMSLVKDGLWVAVFAVQNATPRIWSPAEIALTEETAERTWAALEQARAETALRRREAELARIQRIGGIGGFDIDLGLGQQGLRVVSDHSPEYRAVHGLEPVGADLAGLEEHHGAWLRRLHPEDREPAAAALQAALAGDSATYQNEYRIIRPSDGASRWIVARADIERDASGRAVRLIGAHIDVTPQKQTEAALRESEERLRQFGEASSDVLWIRDAGTLRLDYLTPAFERIYGLPREGGLGEHDFQGWAATILEVDRSRALSHIARVRGGEAVTFEYRIRRPDGEIRWLRNSDFPIRDGRGRVRWIGGIGKDVTEEKRIAARQEVLVAELQHRSRNLLAVIRAVAFKTLGRGGAVAAFDQRLAALSRAQGLLSRFGSDTVELGALVRAELEAHAELEPPRILIQGPEVSLSVEQVQTFSLALHELATNAVKYGALRDDLAGQLSVRWQIHEAGDEDRLPPPRVPGRPARPVLRWVQLEWQEQGLDLPPAAGAPDRPRGYGRELIEEALPYSLGARTDYALREGGLRCRIALPLR
ncbi:PAS domain-containing protein [Roseomonas sp. 18066]|uniref:PAS domain-containing protein n=1 Tax=Roseomonas sp. 18066 TaxID=2681412 RepID=UPI00135AB216|nr:PAS domain-containing protein [Roseomonas sp. 18066]